VFVNLSLRRIKLSGFSVGAMFPHFSVWIVYQLRMFQYSLLGCTAASTHLNTMFRGLALSPSLGKTDLTYCSSVPCFVHAAAGRIGAQTVKSVGGLSFYFKIKLHPDNINRDGGYIPSRAWQPAIRRIGTSQRGVRAQQLTARPPT
jgi:hypothetical protein